MKSIIEAFNCLEEILQDTTTLSTQQIEAIKTAQQSILIIELLGISINESINNQ